MGRHRPEPEPPLLERERRTPTWALYLAVIVIGVALWMDIVAFAVWVGS